jgi:gamma-glutamyltranspeptidase/glutathione hydrolase
MTFPHRHASRAALAAALLSVAVACAPRIPEGEVHSTTGAVVSSSQLASHIGAAAIAAGGNAVDGAVATAFALAVTHPSAGNIGGGGFMVIRLADGTATTIDYREKAPLSATPTMYLNRDGSINAAATDSGWRASGVPGTVRGLAMAHAKYGKRPWADLVRPSAELAERGFPLSTALAAALNRRIAGSFKPFPTSVAAYGKPGGGEWAAGDTLRLPQLARALHVIADQGPDAFYTGWIADSIDAQMRANRGTIRKADLAAYQAVERAPVRGAFMGHELIGMGPPSSGGMVMLMVLQQLEALGVAGMAPDSTPFLHRRAEATRRAFLERARWMGDVDFVPVPVERLASRAQAESLARTIDVARASSSLELGRDIVTDDGAESKETTHFSVVDAEGNAVSNTYTLEASYGSSLVVAGFLLNNEMGDFNQRPGYTNTQSAIGTPTNVIAPGKRMLSSMSPTIVTKDGQLRLVTGSPGGRTIPNTTLDVVLGVTLFGRGARAAVDAPRMHHQWMPDRLSIEAGAASPGVIEELKALGHEVREGRAASQGEAHTIVYDAAARKAMAAADRRGSDAGVGVPGRAARP